MSWLAGLALAQIIIGLYWLITRWRRFNPWSPHAKISLRMQTIEMFVNGLPHFVFSYACMRMIYPLMALALIYYLLWIAFVLRTALKKRPPRGRRTQLPESTPQVSCATTSHRAPAHRGDKGSRPQRRAARRSPLRSCEPQMKRREVTRSYAINALDRRQHE